MLRKLRSRSLAGAGAVLLVLSMTGLAAAATLVDDTTPATLSTFEDLNGNGIDDDCETAVTADAAAVTAAMAAVDTNADGVSRPPKRPTAAGSAARTATTVATSVGSPTARPTSAMKPRPARVGRGFGPRRDRDGTRHGDRCGRLRRGTAEADETDAADDAARAACEAALAAGTPLVLPEMTHVELAQSDVIGGKNCNHGGAVSDANKAAKAERDAAKLAAKEARQAAREAKTHGKANKHSKHGGQN